MAAQDKDVNDQDAFFTGDEEQPVVPAEEYNETKCFQCCTRAQWPVLVDGVGLCVLAGLCTPWPGRKPIHVRRQFNGAMERPCSPEVRDAAQKRWDLAPAYSKTLLWMSLAHHTEAWDEHWNVPHPTTSGF